MKKGALLLLCLALLLCACGALGEAATETAAQEEAAPSMTLSKTEMTINRGKTARLDHILKNAKTATYTWETSDPKVATVTYGAVKGMGPGTAVITCTAKLPDGTRLTAEATVTVLMPVSGVTLISPQDVVLNVGESFAFSAKVEPENASDPSLEWASSNPEVARVDGKGTVTAVSAGKATITATAKDGSKQRGQKIVYVRSMLCEEQTVFVTGPEGKHFTLSYFGKDWKGRAAVTSKGKYFNYSVTEKDGKVDVFLSPLAVGRGSLTFSDRMDPYTRITVVVRVTVDAIPLNQTLLFTDVMTRKDSLTLSVLNHSGKDAAAFDLRFIPYNKEGEQLFLSEKPGGEIRHYQVAGRFGAGKTIQEKLFFSPYTGVEYLEVALVSVTFTDGTRIDLADQALYWYSTRTKKYQEAPAAAAVNCLPDSETREKDESFWLGYVYSEVTPELTEHYGYVHSGICVTEVEKGSLAEKAGLRAGDLIYAADGVPLETDPWAVSKAKAGIAGGGRLTLSVERPGETGTKEVIITRPKQ